MKKDIITNEHIITDLQKLAALFRSLAITNTVGAMIVTALMCGFAAFSIAHTPDTISVWIRVAVVLVCIVTALMSCYPAVLDFGHYTRIKRAIQQGDFYITEDRLLYTATKHDNVPRYTARSKRLPVRDTYYRLVFMNCGTYGLLCSKFYTWSEEYALSPQGVYYLAKADDIFYVVIINNNIPLMVYNTNYFEYQP